jgi:DNA-binding MarR family transcriptional regulator
VTAGRRPAAATAPLEGTLAFMRLLWGLGHGLQAASKRMARDLGITGPQRLVVRALDSAPGLTPGQVARKLLLDPGTVTGIVQRLIRDGLVRSAPDPHDGRRSLLALTARGALLVSRRGGTVEERVEAALARLTPEEKAAAQRALSTLVAALGEEPAQAEGAAPARRKRRKT